MNLELITMKIKNLQLWLDKSHYVNNSNILENNKSK